MEALIKHKSVTNQSEWVGTTIHWEIREADTGCTVLFRHLGLIPQLECFEICMHGWDYYLGSLQAYINIGKGKPYV